ncbi:MAG TPA: hypothetical protein VHC63_18105 [Acidimicrobiales bacterium]|nr:hypothetical protein [Acidimicrobiales bacterium]
MNKPARVVLAVVVAALLAGDVAGYRHATRSQYPSHWDARVADLVKFVEGARHLRYDHPVPVEFLSEAEYKKQNGTSPDQLSAADKRDLRTFEGEAHALGLLGRDVDLVKQLNTLGSSGTLAYYDDQAEKVVVRGTKIDVATRVTLAHELTHALQDQNFDISRKFSTDGANSFFDALIEGDAVRIENQYVDSLSRSEQNEYYREDDAERSKAQDELAGVPPSLLQLFGAPYDLGEPLTRFVVEQQGVAGLNKLFRHPADSDEGLLDALAATSGEHRQKVAVPALQPGETRTDKGDFGVVPWYVVLSSFVDQPTALAAVDGWGGDSYVGYRKNNRPCIRIAFQGDTPNDNAEMTNALNQWKAAFTENTVQVVAMANGVQLDACEPNVVPTPRADAANSMELPATRLELLDVFVQSNVPAKTADCMARHIVTTIPLDKLNSDSNADQQQLFNIGQQIGRACASGQLS